MYGTPLRFKCWKIYINAKGLIHYIGSTIVTDCLIYTGTIHRENATKIPAKLMHIICYTCKYTCHSSWFDHDIKTMWILFTWKNVCRYAWEVAWDTWHECAKYPHAWYDMERKNENYKPLQKGCTELPHEAW